MTVPKLSIPPISQVLKHKKMSFSNFIQILQDDQKDFILDKIQPPTTSKIAEIALQKIVLKEDQLIVWNDLFNYLSKHLKINNGNTINQIKPELVLK